MLGAKVVPDGFDARRDARSRTYCYRLYCSPAAEPVRAGPLAVLAAPDLPGPAGALRRGPGRARTTSPRSPRRRPRHVRFERDVIRAEWMRGRSYAPAAPARGRDRRAVRVLDRGELVPARDDPGAGRHDARGRLGPPRLRGLHGAAGGRAARGGRRQRARRTASTSRRSTTDAGVSGARPPATRLIESMAMRVLITNDDGIGAKGLQALRRALAEMPELELSVIAPDSNRSATARCITTRSPLWVRGDRPSTTARAASRPTGRPSTASASPTSA